MVGLTTAGHLDCVMWPFLDTSPQRFSLFLITGNTVPVIENFAAYSHSVLLHVYSNFTGKTSHSEDKSESPKIC